MKIDEHCLLDQGYDTKLKADCEDNWVVIPRRYRLEPEEWVVVEDGRPPIDYMYLANPFERPHDIEYGLHGSEWKSRHYERRAMVSVINSIESIKPTKKTAVITVLTTG